MTTSDWQLLPTAALESTPPPVSRGLGLISPEFSSPTYDKENSAPVKRSMEVDVTGSTGPALKRTKLTEAPDDFVLPEPEEMPEVVFKSNSKPPFSYANMIGMALLRAPGRKLTLAEIYDWIATHFSYYERGQVGWQNSIRHNLSLNKAFQKTEKSKDKKGHFWQIVEGREYMFCNIKETKRSGTVAGGKKVKKQASEYSDSSSDDSKANSSTLPTPSTPVSKMSSSFGEQPDLTPKSSPANFKTPLTSHNISLLQSSPMMFDSPIANMTTAHALAHMNTTGNQTLDFTCSFSSTNFEMSPMGPMDQGPILEPITPQRKLGLASIHHQMGPLHHKHSSGFKTPLMSTTPLQGKRNQWASPSYLDDFLLSPVGKLHHQVSPHKLGKRMDSAYSTNEIFGIDIGGIHSHEEDPRR